MECFNASTPASKVIPKPGKRFAEAGMPAARMSGSSLSTSLRSSSPICWLVARDDDVLAVRDEDGDGGLEAPSSPLPLDRVSGESGALLPEGSPIKTFVEICEEELLREVDLRRGD